MYVVTEKMKKDRFSQKYKITMTKEQIKTIKCHDASMKT